MSSVSTIPAPKFVTEDVRGGGQPRTVNRIAALDAYIVQYQDTENKPQVRIVFKAPGSDQVFILNEKIGEKHLATTGTDWFKDGVNSLLQGQSSPGADAEGVGSI